MNYLKPHNASCANGKIRGVNLGGWLVVERWMYPSKFADIPEPNNGDWGYCEYLGKEECRKRLQKHWETWFTKKDFVNLYNSGINLVRIPIGYWSFVPIKNEPFVQGAEPFFLKALQWAEEVGLKVMIDLHGHAGSQNGFDNSGKAGTIEWTKKPGSIENSLKLVELITKKYIKKFPKTIHSLEIVNEPANWGINMTVLKEFYSKSYKLVQKIAPNTQIVFADGFMPFEYWDDFMKNYPSVIMDTHMYHVFSNDKYNFTHSGHIEYSKHNGQRLHNSTYPMMVAEWSIGTAVCLEWKDGNCAKENYTFPPTKEYNNFARSLFSSQSEQYETYSKGWVFWAAKTEDRPEWSYLTSLKRGWVPDWSHCAGQKDNMIEAPSYSLPPITNNYQRPALS